jgi:hypothetical protein
MASDARVGALARSLGEGGTADDDWDDDADWSALRHCDTALVP